MDFSPRPFRRFIKKYMHCNITAKKISFLQKTPPNLLVCLFYFFFGYICTLPYHYRKLLLLLTHTFTSKTRRETRPCQYQSQSQISNKIKCAFLLLQKTENKGALFWTRECCLCIGYTVHRVPKKVSNKTLFSLFLFFSNFSD